MSVLALIFFQNKEAFSNPEIRDQFLGLVDKSVKQMITNEEERKRFLLMYERACIRRLDYRDMVDNVPLEAGAVLLGFMISLFAVQRSK